MYLNILKRDLRRRKTMNAILLIFITLAATFIASSVGNMLTVSTALDTYFEKANVPDYWFAATDYGEIEHFKEFADANHYEYQTINAIQIDPKNVTVDEEVFDYGNTCCLSALGGIHVFDKNGEELTDIKDGEIYVTAEIFNSPDHHLYEGCKLTIQSNGKEKEFTVRGYTKDALFGSSMIGMTRLLISENDYAFFDPEQTGSFYSAAVYTDDPGYYDNFMELDLNLIFNVDYPTIKMMYLMDMLTAAIILVVSVCLILISMVIIHFTIHFTMSEELREIGVMKAIGIPTGSIRGFYTAKYLAISVIGAAISLPLSVPFGNLLLTNAANNILIVKSGSFLLNILCSALTASIVVLFCYFCTGKIKDSSPIDAIRSGETGERYSGKGYIHLSKARLPVIPFMALNDIMSGAKKYISMLVIFTLGILLIIIPVNTINTLQSDHLLKWFSMADCDLIISQEMLLTPDGNNRQTAEATLAEVRNTLAKEGIDAEVYQEIMFRMNVSHNGKRTSSLAFQGIGGVTTDQYAYIEGTAPQNGHEVAISYIIADKIDAHIGDDIEINSGSQTKTYTITAINQSMNNMGEGIRFYQEEALDYDYAAGSFGIQIQFADEPDDEEFARRKQFLADAYPNADIYTAGEYINYMIGDVAGQLSGVKSLILAVILCINLLVAVLMVKSFITKEKSEIAILKAIGFQNNSLTLWQSLRIGLILFFSTIIGTLLATPLSKLIIEPIFRMMGAYSIEFTIKPFEVYVYYPLIVLAVTTFSSFLSAQSLRKISAAEASNIE